MKKAKPFLLLLGVLCILLLLIFRNQLTDYLTEYTTGSYAFETPTTDSSKLDGSWSIDEQGWRYMNVEQHYATDEVLAVDGIEYFFDSDGYMQTGWTQKEDHWYHLSYTGQKEIGWIIDDNKNYYLDPDGIMATGWQVVKGTDYYFQPDGSLAYGWIQLDDKYYYIEENGTTHTGWLIDNDKYYYLNDDGVMATGWINEGGTYYYLGDDGATLEGWQNIDSKNYFFTEYGSLYTGWLTDNGNSYYFDSEGKMATGWLQLDNDRYFMNSEGQMRTGWIIDEHKAYFLNANGVLEANKKAAKEGSVIALTFDDGPGAHTDRLLDVLEANNAKATFFVLGSLVDSYPDTIKRMQTIGCEVGNHTYDHKDLTTLSEEEVKAQIKKTSKKVKAASGKGTKLVRPPYGAYNDNVKEYANTPLIMWSIDTLDWKTKSTTATVELVLNTVQDGDIVLLHDIHSTSVDAAEILIPTLTSMGYKLATVSELAAAKGTKLEKQKTYSSFK